LLGQTDALGNATQYSHDALYRPSSTTNALGQLTQLAYNPLDQLLTVTDARGNVTAYTPNAFGEVLTEQSPDRGTLQRVYTQGHLSSETDARGIAHQYSYDADGRVTTVTALHGSVQYHYDQGSYGAGRLTGIDDPSGSTSYRYNSQGQVVEKVSNVRNGATLRMRYTYTLGGQPQEVLTPGGHLVRYDRDANGQVTRVIVDNQAGSAMCCLPAGRVSCSMPSTMPWASVC
jgi:YD repeat-containing protein